MSSNRGVGGGGGGGGRAPPMHDTEADADIQNDPFWSECRCAVTIRERRLIEQIR